MSTTMSSAGSVPKFGGQPVSRRHADGGRVDENLGALHRGRAGPHGAGGRRLADALAEAFGALCVDVGDGDRRSPLERQRDGDGAARTAGAHQHERPPRRRNVDAGEGTDEADPVEHLAGPRPVRLATQRVDGADHAADVEHAVGERQRALLERQRHHETADVGDGHHPADRVVERRRRHVHRHQRGVDPRRHDLRVVDERRAGLRDRIADDPVKGRCAVDHEARRGLCRCVQGGVPVLVRAAPPGVSGSSVPGRRGPRCRGASCRRA